MGEFDKGKVRLTKLVPPSWVVAGVLASITSIQASAVTLDLGNPDWEARWDNTMRYNVGMRMEGRDPKIANDIGLQNSDYSFNRGDLVTNRFDLISEFDLIYQNRMGMRVSGNGWYDASYDGRVGYNPGQSPSGLPYSNIGSYEGNRYSNYTRRYYEGPSGELLDAFVFYQFDAGDIPVNVKAGRHNIYWGESLFNAVNGIAYSQGAMSLAKATANPGTEAKELYLPLSQISTQLGLTDTLALQAQYYFDWEASRYAEGGTYLGASDYLLNGPDRLFLRNVTGVGPIFAQHIDAREGKKQGDWGINLRWTPMALDGTTLGIYYRQFDEKLPWLLINTSNASNLTYRESYARDTRLLGLSMATSVYGLAIGSELVYRHNTAFNSTSVISGDEGARGDTLHALVNVVGTVNKTPLFDALNWSSELVWSQWLKVTSNDQYFKREGSSACEGGTWDGCVTRSFTGLQLSATPAWYSVMPGVDLSFPINFSIGVKGNSAVLAGGNQGSGSYSFGPSLMIQQRYQVDLKYIDYLARYKNNGTTITAMNGAMLQDRGWLALTFKTTY